MEIHLFNNDKDCETGKAWGNFVTIYSTIREVFEGFIMGKFTVKNNFFYIKPYNFVAF